MHRFLLVDDDQSILEVCTRILGSKFECEIICANSGKKAIEILKRDHSFDLIISDYNMPAGSGLDLLRFKLSQNLGMPFYFYTDEIHPEIPYAGNSFIGVFSKYEFEKLCESIGLILQRKHS